MFVKKIQTLFLLQAFFMGFGSAEAQSSDTLHGTGKKIRDIYASVGYLRPPVWIADVSSFQGMAPGSALLKGDLMQVEKENYASGPVYSAAEGLFVNPVFNRNFCFQGGITFKIKDNEARDFEGPWLRLGFSHFNNSYLLAGGNYRSRDNRTDTFYMVNNQPVSRDSGVYRNVEARYRRQATYVEGNFLYKVNASGIVSAYGGGGILLGLQHSGRLDVRAGTYQQVWDSITVSGTQKVLYQRQNTVSHTSESFDIKPGLSFGAFLNVGVDLRLGEKYNFFRHLHFNAELKPLFRTESVKNQGWQSSVVWIGLAGFRYDLE